MSEQQPLDENVLFAERWTNALIHLEKGDLPQALEVAKECHAKAMPERKYYTTLLQSSLQIANAQDDAALATFDEGLKQGLWYTENMLEISFGEFFKPKIEAGLFKEMFVTWEAMRLEEQARTNVEPAITLPDSLTATDNDQPVPLMLALHGAGEPATDLQQQWQTLHLTKKYICVYPQADTLSGPGQPRWDVTGGDMDIMQALVNGLRTRHSVDMQNSIVGGFSHGGGFALEMTLASTLDINKCLLICPSPMEFDPAEHALNPNARIYAVLGGDDVPAKDMFLEFAEMLKQAGVDIHCEVMPGMRHTFPDNMPELVKQALEFLHKTD